MGLVADLLFKKRGDVCNWLSKVMLVSEVRAWKMARMSDDDGVEGFVFVVVQFVCDFRNDLSKGVFQKLGLLLQLVFQIGVGL